MTYTPMMISGYKTGLEKDVATWRLIDDAFAEISNMYVHRGILKSAVKPILIGRLQKAITGEAIGTGATHYTHTLGNLPVVPGSLTLTDAGGLSVTDDGEGALIGDVDPAGTNTINYLTGAIDVTFSGVTGALTADYEYYPLSPVMGIHLRETSIINFDETMFFDRTTCYTYDYVNLKFIEAMTANETWTGSTIQYFSAINYFIDGAGLKYFWVTNGKEYSLAGAVKQDGIKYYNGTVWATLRPKLTAAYYLNGAKMIAAWKGRLIALNTIEDTASGSINLQNRIHWCAAAVAPTGVDVWRTDLKGNGGSTDVTKNEAITSYAIINDKFIVYLERSIFELAYTGIKSDPFKLREISSDFGSESTFSTQINNGTAITFGQKSISVTDGVRVNRLDEKIPDEIFNINNLINGKYRVQSAKDPVDEFIYWTIAEGENTYCNKMLLFNFQNGSYSYLSPHYTTLGRYQKPSSYKWSTVGMKWSKCDFRWSAARANAETPLIAAGNHQGFVHTFNFSDYEDPSLYVTVVNTTTKVITSPTHNLSIGKTQYILLSNFLGISGYEEDKIYKANAIDADTINVVTDETWTGTYIGGGSIAILNPLRFKTKKFNPLIEKGKNIKVGYIDLFTKVTNEIYYMDGSDKVQLPNFAVNIYADDTVTEPIISNSQVFTSYQDYNREEAEKAWKRIQVNSSGNSIQIECYIPDELLLGENGLDVYSEGLSIHAMRIWLTEAGKNIGLL